MPLSGKSLSATLRMLQLGSMKYNEEVLLIREEYVIAFNTLGGPSQRGGGIVILGQPGIGVCYFSLLALWY